MKTILLLFLLSYNLIYFQIENNIKLETTVNNKFYKDTVFIKPVNDKIIVKFSRDNKIESFDINNENTNLKIAPNFKHKYNVSLEYDFISFSFSLPKSWFVKNDDVNLKGKSSGIDFNFSIYKNHWINKLYYYEIVGYYVENTSDFIDNWNNSYPYIILPDVKIKKIGGVTSYVFNAQKVSIRAINNQTEIQNKSAGSFLATINYEYNYLSNKQDYLKSKQYKYNISPLIEYQYNWVLLNKKILIVPKLSVGYGYSHVIDYDDQTKKYENSNTGIFSLNFNLNINYTYKNLFCGFQYYVNNNYFKESSSKIENKITYNNLYIGYKIHVPRLIKKASTRVKKILENNSDN